MSIEIDRRKCGSEYSLCKRCKHEDEYGSERCRYCTRVVDIGYSMILCGIPIGSGISWLHQNFEDKDAKGGAKKMSREDFEGLRQLAKANHDARVAKTPQRLKYATEQLNQNGITYKVCNETTGQINCYFANGTVLTFYAGTGKIKGYENQRGIKSFIRICVAERDRK